MAKIRLDIVTAERLVYSDEVDEVIAPGVEGQLGILPHHTPLMTMLQPGELISKKDGEEFSLAISGGLLEVRPDRRRGRQPGLRVRHGHAGAVEAGGGRPLRRERRGRLREGPGRG